MHLIPFKKLLKQMLPTRCDPAKSYYNIQLNLNWCCTSHCNDDNHSSFFFFKTQLSAGDKAELRNCKSTAAGYRTLIPV